MQPLPDNNKRISKGRILELVAAISKLRHLVILRTELNQRAEVYSARWKIWSACKVDLANERDGQDNFRED